MEHRTMEYDVDDSDYDDSYGSDQYYTSNEYDDEEEQYGEDEPYEMEPYEYDEESEDEDDLALPVYNIADLLTEGSLVQLPITFDTIEPRITQEISIFEYRPEGSKVFALREEDYRKTVVRIVFSDASSIILYIGNDPLTKQLKKEIRDYNPETIIASDKLPYNLNSATAEIERLNRILGCNDYNLRLDYVYEMEPNSLVYLYDFNIRSIILCLFQDEVCVSSVGLVMDKYDAEIESRTRPEDEGNNLNKLLRAAAISILPLINPDIREVISYAVHSASVYLMIKHFGGVPALMDYMDTEENQAKLEVMIPADHNRFTVDNAVTILRRFGGQINVILPIDEAHIALANQKFEETAGLVHCERYISGGRRSRRRHNPRSNYRQKTRVHHNRNQRRIKKTKRRGKGRSAKRQTKRRQRK
jgi:hypothetical protein